MGTPNKDIIIKDDAPSELLLQKHLDFLVSYAERKNDYEYVVTEYLRMSGIYWTLTALELGGGGDRLSKSEIIEFVKTCQRDCGGFGASVHHDPHLLYTLSALQILVTYEALDQIDVENVVHFISSLQQNDGSFFGDIYGEVDTRFSFCAIAALRLIDRLEAVDVAKATDFVLSCKNFDGGFGVRPGSETHAGQIYCCLGFLAITGNLHLIDPDQLGWWLCERQLPSGGLNGRPEKLPDVCYSWWVLSSLAILGRIHWIDGKKLTRYILACQDAEDGGIADRPGDCVDPFHTLFGLAGLSLLGQNKYLIKVNPVFCMPETVISKLDVSPKLLKI